jgi:hypothetical protein
MTKPKKTRRAASRPAIGVREIAQQHATEALDKLVSLITSKNERIALSAAQTGLDRAHGKVAQAMNLRGPEGGLSIKIVRFKRENDDAT